MSGCFLLYTSVGFGIGKTPVVSNVTIIPGSCPFFLIFRPVDCAFLILVESPHVWNVAVVVVINVVVSGVVRIVIMMMHPWLIHSPVDNNDETAVQIKIGIER